MIDLAIRERQETLHVMDLPYRLSSWALDDPANAGLWFDDGGRLAAWAVMQLPFWTVDCVIPSPADADLDQAVFTWIDRRAHALLQMGGGIPCWFQTAFARQAGRIRQLEANGFTCQADQGEDSWSKVWMQRDASALLKEYPAPPGFEVRPLHGAAEAAAYVELHQAVFGSKNMQLDWRLRMLRQPGYDPTLDVVVSATDGQLAAFCIGWLQRGLDGIVRGQIEPLGCHADFRRFALGRVALAEVIRRLCQAGAAELWVETDNYRDTAFRLYHSLGFRVAEDVLVFRKDYPG
jgi:ribosomal protein S18 acetylase RimI-like enzyme